MTAADITKDKLAIFRAAALVYELTTDYLLDHVVGEEHWEDTDPEIDALRTAAHEVMEVLRPVLKKEIDELIAAGEWEARR